MNRTDSTNAGTRRRAPVIIDHGTQRVHTDVNPTLDGFFDDLLTTGKDLAAGAASFLTDTAKQYATTAIQTKLETEKIQAQTKAKLAEQEQAAALALKKAQADAAAAKAAAGGNVLPTVLVTAGVPWYSNAKVMLPIAALLGFGWYAYRKKRKHRG